MCIGRCVSVVRDAGKHEAWSLLREFEFQMEREMKTGTIYKQNRMALSVKQD